MRWERATAALVTDDSNIMTLKTDAVLAVEIRAALAPLLDQVVAIMNDAKARGLSVNFNIAFDAYGRHAVAPVSVTKIL